MIRQNTDITGIFRNNHEHKTGQYAEDTQLYLDGTEKSISASLDTIQSFYRININI